MRVLATKGRSSNLPQGKSVSSKGHKPANVADALIDALVRHGLERVFGLPGGGSNLDLIEAARRQGIEFILARHETSAVMMAAVDADLNDSVGLVLVTKGPGVANAVNGVAHASLDRSPIVLVTDGVAKQQFAFISHQVFDQKAMLAPIVKAYSRLDGPDAGAEMSNLVTTAMTPRKGPVHIELTASAARANVRNAPRHMVSRMPAASAAALVEARAIIATAKCPVVVAGLETRGAHLQTRALVEALGCPALVTYKAKGVIPDSHPLFAGIFTGGALEQRTVRQADLIILVGLDPVELITQPWPYTAPILEVGFKHHPVHYVVPVASLHGDLTENLKRMTSSTRRPTEWTKKEIATLRENMAAALAYRGSRAGLTPEAVVKIAAEMARPLTRWPRATVDAGAHMFSATAFWPCRAPHDLLISNGLASMGFALPAAIASALHDRKRVTIAFTGDGGLLMCLGELATAVQQDARVVIVVFNDGSLSLIDIKQQQREFPPQGVRWKRPDFAAVIKGLGGRGYRAGTAAGYRRALREAYMGRGPALIDVIVDPSGYTKQLKSMRG